jgi:hypothetical protein
VAPRAKMNQQRTRRFLSAHISDVTDQIGESRLSSSSCCHQAIALMPSYAYIICVYACAFLLQLKSNTVKLYGCTCRA